MCDIGSAICINSVNMPIFSGSVFNYFKFITGALGLHSPHITLHAPLHGKPDMYFGARCCIPETLGRFVSLSTILIIHQLEVWIKPEHF